MATLRAFVAVALLLAVKAYTCSKHDVPVDPEFIGKKASATTHCGVSAGIYETHFNVDLKGVHFQPMLRKYADGRLCSENITSVFRRNGMPAAIYYRPDITVKYIKKKFPKIHKQWLNNKGVYAVCDAIPFETILAWGQDRNKFINLLRKMYHGIKYIRDFKCGPQQVSLVGPRFPDTAMNHLRSVAYANFFCI